MPDTNTFESSRTGDFVQSLLGERRSKAAVASNVVGLTVSRVSPFRVRLDWTLIGSQVATTVYASTDNSTWLPIGSGTNLGGGNWRFESSTVNYLNPNTFYSFSVQPSGQDRSPATGVTTYPDVIILNELSDFGNCDQCALDEYAQAFWDGKLYWVGHIAGYKNILLAPSSSFFDWRPLSGSFPSGFMRVREMLFYASSRVTNSAGAYAIGFQCYAFAEQEYLSAQLSKPTPMYPPLGTFLVTSNPGCSTAFPGSTISFSAVS